MEPAAPVRIEPRHEPRQEGKLVFLADALAFKSLCAHPTLGGPDRLRWSVQHSVSYDTEAADLRRSGLSLQMRLTRGRNVMSLQKSDNVGAIEVAAPGDAPQLELLPPPARGLIARVTARRVLRPSYASQMRRATRLLAYEGAMIEIAFEEGEIVADERKTRVCEIVLATKAGEPAALYRLGLALTQVEPLRLGVAGPFDRGGVVWAKAPDFGAEITLDAAIAALLRQNLAHFLGNWPAMGGAETPEAVHQIRVALRRLRSLLAVLGRRFPSSELVALRAEAKRIADAFGPARDWRVFSDMVAQGPRRRLPGVAALADLVALADARAEAGQAQASATLAAAATTRFALMLQVYIATRGWRNAAGAEDLRALGEPATGFAAQALEDVFGRLKKRAHGFEKQSPEARHRVRIALKQMRYAVDFFGHLFKPASAVEDFSRSASALQEMLGAANDASVAAHLVASLDAREPALAFAAGTVVGWCERGGLVDEKALLRGWKALRKAKRFWRDDLPVAA